MVHICGNCLWYQKNCSHFNQFTLQDEDACLIAYMRHEDGNIIYFLSDWCFKVNRSLPLYNAQLPRPFLHSTKMYQLNNWSSILPRSRWNPSTLLQVIMKIIINAKLRNILVYHERQSRKKKVLKESENIKLQRLAFGGHLPLCLWLLRVGFSEVFA